MATDLADNVWRRMRDRSLSQNELAGRAGLNRSTVSRILNGEVSRVHSKTLRGLASALECTVTDLLDPEAASEDRVLELMLAPEIVSKFGQASLRLRIPRDALIVGVLEAWAHERPTGPTETATAVKSWYHGDGGQLAIHSVIDLLDILLNEERSGRTWDALTPATKFTLDKLKKVSGRFEQLSDSDADPIAVTLVQDCVTWYSLSVCLLAAHLNRDVKARPASETVRTALHEWRSSHASAVASLRRLLSRDAFDGVRSALKRTTAQMPSVAGLG